MILREGVMCSRIKLIVFICLLTHRFGIVSEAEYDPVETSG